MEGITLVSNFIRENDLGIEIKTFEKESTRTSPMAAQALGCSVAQIAKSIAFICVKEEKEKPIIVILSGDKKVSQQKLAAVFAAESTRKMSPDEVLSRTGYIIGGVPPFPHNADITVIADESLFRFDKVYAAAGSPEAIMSIPPSLLTDKLSLPMEDVSE